MPRVSKGEGRYASIVVSLVRRGLFPNYPKIEHREWELERLRRLGRGRKWQQCRRWRDFSGLVFWVEQRRGWREQRIHER